MHIKNDITNINLTKAFILTPIFVVRYNESSDVIERNRVPMVENFRSTLIYIVLRNKIKKKMNDPSANIVLIELA